MHKKYYQMSTDELMSYFSSQATGLSSREAEVLQTSYGSNSLEEGRKKSLWMIILGQFKDFMILILIIAAVVSGMIGELSDTVIILLIIVLNGVIGTVQEFRAEKAVRSLKQLAVSQARVFRDGEIRELPATELVPGDIVELSTGNLVPADLRVIEAHNLKTHEAILTGESASVAKSSDPITEEDLGLSEQHNMLFKGTAVVYGRGLAMVTATGMATELGKIAQLLQEEESETPLQRRLGRFGKRLSIVILLLCTVFFVVGTVNGHNPMVILLTSISLAVAALPEALPAVVTIALALGAKRLLKRHSLIRKLPAVETLGSVTHICFDKTGTLTQNKMTVVDLFPENEEAELWINRVMLLNNDAQKDKDNKVIGEPTEVALYEYGLKSGASKNDYPRIAELSFDSTRKMMTTFHEFEGEIVALTKGAPDVLFERSMMSAEEHEQWEEQVASQAEAGRRVMGFALRKWSKLPEVPESDEVETKMEFLGLASLIDPPRPEADEAVRVAKKAGIKPVMITGDHPATAEAIARELSIIYKPDHLIYTGKQLSETSDETLRDTIEDIRVYARVSPEQKVRIVEVLQRKGYFVAMTGDGVNDSPALKKANIGIAMGLNGTDVAREASHMVLLDDNFATIVKAIKEGRRIYDNIRKFVRYVLTSNTAEIFSIFMAPLLGLPIPLLAVHILWINLITDGLPGLALSFERSEQNVMNRPPRPPKENLFAQGLGLGVVVVGIFMGMLTLLTQAISIQMNIGHWQTMVFTVLSFAQLFYVLSVRSEFTPIYKLKLTSNPWIIYFMLPTAILQLAVIYVPAFNKVLHTEALTMEELLLSLGIATLTIPAGEVYKYYANKNRMATQA